MCCFHKNRGAISVFLVIILVPCMLVSSIFVDISRVQLSRAVAESSADLALSTLMTYYDYDLNEYYGLMGSCQDIDAYYSSVEGYYDMALHSRDVEDEDIQLLYQQVMGEIESWFDNEEISDLLQIRNQTEGAVITSVAGADMYNATILQEQVVEFMKYRGPIVIAQDIIEKLQKDSGAKDLEESHENDEIVKDKEEFYKAEGELLKTAFDVYWCTRDYTDEAAKGDMSAEKLQEYAQRLKDYREAYQEIHCYLVGNLMNTQDLTVYSHVTIDLNKYMDHYDKTSSEIYSRKEMPTPAPTPGATAAPTAAPAPFSEPVYYIDGDRVTALLNELTTALNDFEAARTNFANAGSSLMNTLPGSGDSEAYAIQWWVRMDKAVNTGTDYTTKLRSRADALVKAYAKVCAIWECEPGNNMPDNWESEGERLKEDTERVHSTYLKKDIDGNTDVYLRTVAALEQVSNANIKLLKPENLRVTVDGQERALGDAIVYIKNQLEMMQGTVQKYMKLLDKLFEAEKGKTALIDQLSELAGEYASTLNDWSNSANGSSTDLAKEHQEEIERVKTLQDEDKDKDSTDICLEIDKEAVEEMKTRLSNIYSQYQIIDESIGSMLYGSEKLVEISNVDTMKVCAGNEVQNNAIGLTNREVTSYADDTFSRLFQPNTGEIAKLHDTRYNMYNPLMDPGTGEVDTPELYMYMHGRFQDYDRELVEKEEKDQEEANNEKTEMEKDAKDKGRYQGYVYGAKDITPTEASKGKNFNFGNSLESLANTVSDLLNGRINNIRDNLYVTTYIMNMFSYATFENEGYYGLLEDETKKELNPIVEEYKEVYQQKKGPSEESGTWLSMDPKDTYNKTLTNRLINADNNIAYLAEVEYILYGQNNGESVKKVYGDIYELRLVLNTISAFANFWSGSSKTSTAINSVADTVAALTGGIIPAALTKVILLPVLSVFETCKDLDRLEAGFPVELYKKPEDWWYGFDNSDEDINWKDKKVKDFLNALKGFGNGKNQDKGLQYSDYLTLLVYLGLSGDKKTAEKMYLRMGDVIQANMQKATGNEEYTLENTQVYFQLKSKLRVEPLMLTLPYFTDYVEDPAMKDDWCTFEVETIRGY